MAKLVNLSRCRTVKSFVNQSKSFNNSYLKTIASRICNKHSQQFCLGPIPVDNITDTATTNEHQIETLLFLSSHAAVIQNRNQRWTIYLTEDY